MESFIAKGANVNYIRFDVSKQLILIYMYCICRLYINCLSVCMFI